MKTLVEKKAPSLEWNELWNHPFLSDEEKYKVAFHKLLDAKIKNASVKELNRLKKTLQNLYLKLNHPEFKDEENSFHIYDQFIRLTDPSLQSFQSLHVAVHELEHAFTEGSSIRKRLLRILTELIVSKKTMQFRYESEGYALGAQWELIQTIPPEVRERILKNIQKNPSFNNMTEKTSLENAALSKEDYITKMRVIHEYTPEDMLDLYQEGLTEKKRELLVLSTLAGVILSSITFLILSVGDDSKDPTTESKIKALQDLKDIL